MEHQTRGFPRWVWVLLAVMLALAVLAEFLGWTRDVGHTVGTMRPRSRTGDWVTTNPFMDAFAAAVLLLVGRDQLWASRDPTGPGAARKYRVVGWVLSVLALSFVAAAVANLVALLGA